MRKAIVVCTLILVCLMVYALCKSAGKADKQIECIKNKCFKDKNVKKED